MNCKAIIVVGKWCFKLFYKRWQRASLAIILQTNFKVSTSREKTAEKFVVLTMKYYEKQTTREIY